ncbi:MAG TPA: PKD domain-containing protein, partial [Bacteroidales bacterium]|nr:PKD domain-containing protein [Bacteroidales bacterium]
ADFDWHKSMHTPYKVKFHDKSDFQAGSWAWEFGDGQVSDERNPEHVYAAAGDYTVTLTINSADSSCVDAYSETVTLDTIVFDCEADFDWHKSMHTPYKVKFQDKSHFQAGSWAWEFGDGEVSAERNPEHIYAAAGAYTVTLTINSADSTCVDTFSETVTLDTVVFDCEADFDWHKSMHTAYKVKFQDKSHFQAGSWAWEFGDGEVSAERNPEHIYAAAGAYTVTLTINSADSTCVDTFSETVTLDTVVFGCNASFEYNASWHNPMKIHFHDQSDFLPGNWHWDFGDGESSTSRNPQHTYTTGGDFIVTLTIASADSSCTDSYSETLTIEDLTMNCQANFWWHHNHQNNNPLEKKFKDNSYTFSPISTYAWDFGDGASSSEENPVHVYSNFGMYNVSLEILTESGCSSSKSISVLVIDPTQDCAAMFVPVIDSVNPLQVAFNDLSLGGADGWIYDFGDGTTSNEQNPVHIYPESEVYLSSLTITAGNCTSSFYYEIDLVNGQVFAIPGGVTGVSNETAVQISFYPNPVDNILSVNTFGNQLSEVNIINLAGQTLITTNEANINVSKLPKGLYFVTAIINEKLINSKFIKK